MDVRPIRSEEDLDWALAEIDRLMDAGPGTPEGDRLEILVTLVQAYEARHHRIEAPDPIEAIRHAMEAKGLRQADLESAIGGSGRVSEVMRRKRALTLPMMRALSRQLGIGIDVLAQPYELSRDAA
ncbi:MAG TPA: transcriptional regulator [Azospirillaceae bacterium]|nr:transcriptional regulator [Azospirillaceae bacterium]